MSNKDIRPGNHSLGLELTVNNFTDWSNKLKDVLASFGSCGQRILQEDADIDVLEEPAKLTVVTYMDRNNVMKER